MDSPMRRALLALCILAAAAPAALAQDVTPPGFRLPPLTAVTAATPAKELFGRKAEPAPLETRSIGFYAKGCLAGAMALPVNGQTWQVMRLSRNRNWGNPAMVAFLEHFSAEVPEVAGWPGI